MYEVVMKKYSKRFLNTKLTYIEDILNRIAPLQTDDTTYDALKNAGQFDARHLFWQFLFVVKLNLIFLWRRNWLR